MRGKRLSDELAETSRYQLRYVADTKNNGGVFMTTRWALNWGRAKRHRGRCAAPIGELKAAIDRGKVRIAACDSAGSSSGFLSGSVSFRIFTSIVYLLRRSHGGPSFCLAQLHFSPQLGRHWPRFGLIWMGLWNFSKLNLIHDEAPLHPFQPLESPHDGDVYAACG